MTRDNRQELSTDEDSEDWFDWWHGQPISVRLGLVLLIVGFIGTAGYLLATEPSE